MSRYPTTSLAWRASSLFALLVVAESSKSKNVAAPSQCDGMSEPFSDAGSFIQVPVKVIARNSANVAEQSLLEPVFEKELSIGEVSSSVLGDAYYKSVSSSVLADAYKSVGLSKILGMQAWLVALESTPTPKPWPISDGAHRSWLGTSVQRHIIMVCIATCFVCLCLWAWRQTGSRSCKQAHRDSCESEIRRRRSNSDIQPSTSARSVEVGLPSQPIFVFRSEEELLETFAALPVTWRHVCILMCTILGFAGAGAMNDTIGLTFGSFEEEWGPQTPSRLACLSLFSTAGQIVSSIVVGEIADHRGRCFVARYASVLVALCFWCSRLAPSLELLALARLLGGLGFGALNVAVPTLMSESVPKHARCLLVLYQFGWPLGAAAFTCVMSTAGWRAANVAFLPGASLILVMFWCPGGLPESPKWLCSQGRLQDAADSVCQYGAVPPSPSRETSVETIDETAPTVPAPVALEEQKDSQVTTTESDSTHLFYVHTALSMLCVASAAMLIKVWLPALLVLRGVHSNNMAFVTMWIVEAGSLCVSGLLFGAPANSTRDDNLVLLRVSQGAFLIAAFAVLAYMEVTSAWLITLLGGIHLLGQANAANFLMAFATLSFPVAVRARCVAGIFLAQHVGCFVGPLLGSVLLQFFPNLGAYSVLTVGSVMYSCGFLRSLSLSKLTAT